MKTKGVQKFKKTEIGVIPNNWTVKSLDKIIDLKNGKISPQRNISGKIPVYGSNGIIGFTDKTTSFENSIIIGRVGEYCGSVFFSKVKCWVTDNAITGHAKDNTSSLFLYYLLKNLELNKRRGGSGQPLLNQSSINSIEVVLPIILTEQKAIAKILSDLDSKIELNQKMNKTLEKIAQTVFKSWFVDYEFPDENGNPYRSSGGKMAWNEELKKSIPEKWKIKKIEELCISIENGSTPKRMKSSYWSPGTIPWYKTGELNDGVLIQSEEKISKFGLMKSSCHLWPKGTILIAIYAFPVVGRLGILTNESTSNQACSGMIPKLDYGTPFLFYSLLFSRNSLGQIATGTAQQNISQKIVRQHKIVVPILKLIKRFNIIIENIHYQFEINKQQIIILENLRDSLLPKLMSGKIRVPLND